MLSVEQQIAEGRMVCPITHQRLTICGDHLQSLDGRQQYPYLNGLPVMLNPAKQAEYLSQLDGSMAREYTEPDQRPALVRGLERLSFLGGDYRGAPARQAFAEAVAAQPAGALCLSVGGGPKRAHPNLVNLNIGAFANVDVVGDAYGLPYADGAVDAVECEAVLEHLEFPSAAVAEMYRVLRVGGRVFAATPFLQKFHGYPNHYQNFTLIGHQGLFTRARFTIKASGTCVGPTFALLDLVTNYAMYLPTRFISRWAYRSLRLLSVPFRPIDLWLNQNPAAHELASTTFVYAVKEANPPAAAHGGPLPAAPPAPG